MRRLRASRAGWGIAVRRACARPLSCRLARILRASRSAPEGGGGTASHSTPLAVEPDLEWL
jgi:hypothetical protein